MLISFYIEQQPLFESPGASKFSAVIIELQKGNNSISISLGLISIILASLDLPRQTAQPDTEIDKTEAKTYDKVISFCYSRNKELLAVCEHFYIRLCASTIQ